MGYLEIVAVIALCCIFYLFYLFVFSIKFDIVRKLKSIFNHKQIDL